MTELAGNGRPRHDHLGLRARRTRRGGNHQREQHPRQPARARPHAGAVASSASGASALTLTSRGTSASSTTRPRILTLTIDDTPGSCIVTPYTASAASVVVRGLCVMTMNCVRVLN